MSIPDRSIDPRLLMFAQEEFMEFGFIKAELKRICKNADITTGAVYKRYKGKEDLFSAVVAEVEYKLNDFLKQRSNVDFSSLSDQEVHDLWIMTYENMIPFFELLYENREKFILLIDKAAGTRYENFSHEYVTKMSYVYEQYYDEAVKRGLAHAKVTREEFHVLLSAFWTCICEPFVHNMSWKEIENHCKTICRFFDWKSVIGLD